ncbi:MAG: hypothetical protein IPH16_10445 [Haliscomenobacter sp.]|nr:hypothetical protein [Haliscomenobacter sp.]
MTGAIHSRIVLDAIRYILEKEHILIKLYLGACENSWFGGDFSKPVEQWKMYQLIGGESKNTDYYHDLAMYSKPLGRENVTEYDGIIFTALSHYVSAHKPPTKWGYRDGYNYYYSSRTGSNNSAMVGKVDDNDVEVDNDYSPIVDRCAQYWKGTLAEYNANWEKEIRNTIFIPASAMARYYYEKFLFQHATYIDVNGEVHDKIIGFMLLGPVMHAIADACVPHHFTSELGNFHQEWESYVDTLGQSGLLLDFQQADTLYKNHLAKEKVVFSIGSMKGLLNIEYLIANLCAHHGYDKLRQLNPGKNICSPDFWKSYFTGSNYGKVASDAKYLYNLAVAATARVLLQAFMDVSKSAQPGFDYDVATRSLTLQAGQQMDPHKLWDKFLALPPIKQWMEQATPKGLGFLKQISGHTIPLFSVEAGLPSNTDIPYAKSSLILQFEPRDWRKSTSILNQVRNNMLRWNKKELTDDEVRNDLDYLETTLMQEFRKAYHEMKITYAQPLKKMEFPEEQRRLRETFGLPEVSRYQDLNPEFGLATYRRPTLEETKNANAFDAYVKAAQANALNAQIILLTRCLATHKVALEVITDVAQKRKIQASMNKIQKTRNHILRYKTLPPVPSVTRQPELEPVLDN